ncbi:MAG: hypothetical protein K5924_06450 [Chloroflexi bacterium]|nr:hypothetical protein [Chloroflexota bacterium]
MTGQRRLLLVGTLALVVPLGACAEGSSEHHGEEPAVLEPVGGDDGLLRIRLTENAAARLAIETAPIESASGGMSSVPYGAIFYGTDGETWVYISPEPLVFMREPVVVDRIEDGVALLTNGPPEGTAVATVGVAELFGTEIGMGGAAH